MGHDAQGEVNPPQQLRFGQVGQRAAKGRREALEYDVHVAAKDMRQKIAFGQHPPEEFRKDRAGSRVVAQHGDGRSEERLYDLLQVGLKP